VRVSVIYRVIWYTVRILSVLLILNVILFDCILIVFYCVILVFVVLIEP